MAGQKQPKKRDKPVYVVGAGAVGLLFARYCQLFAPVTVVTRSNQTGTPYFYQHELVTTPLNVSHAHFEHLQRQSIERVLICVKAYQLPTALEQLWPYLSNDATIVISHNGMSDLTPWLARLTQQQQMWFATTNMGGFKSSPDTVVHKGIGATWLGNLSHGNLPIPSLITAMQTHFPQCAIHENIQLLRWQKLLVNVAINPISAREDVNNGVLRQPYFASEILGLLNEAVWIANQNGVTISLSDALELAYQVMQQTAHNRSSMRQDIHLKRETEIDAICGFICRQAQQKGSQTPFNARLLTQIQKKSA
ncbi:ketopantoate reductase family protein [Pseudoalteromonas xiamenensis]